MNECNLQKNKKQTYQKTISLVPDFMTCVGVHRKMRHPSDKKGRGGGLQIHKRTSHLTRLYSIRSHFDSADLWCAICNININIITSFVVFFFSFSRFCLSFLKLFLFCFVECIFWGGTVLNLQIFGGVIWVNFTVYR